MLRVKRVNLQAFGKRAAENGPSRFIGMHDKVRGWELRALRRATGPNLGHAPEIGDNFFRYFSFFFASLNKPNKQANPRAWTNSHRTPVARQNPRIKRTNNHRTMPPTAADCFYLIGFYLIGLLNPSQNPLHRPVQYY